MEKSCSHEMKQTENGEKGMVKRKGKAAIQGEVNDPRDGEEDKAVDESYNRNVRGRKM